MTYSLSGLVAAFSDWTALQVAAGWTAQRTADYYSNLHKKFLADAGDLQLHELRAYHLLTWGTSWHRVQSVQRLFNWGIMAELVERNPFRNVRKPPQIGRRRIMSRREELRTLRRAHPRFREFLFAMRESMARPQEIRAVTWDDLHYSPAAGHFFALEEYKGRNRRSSPADVRIIPITPRLARLLARLALRDPEKNGLIFKNSRKKPWTRNALRCAMRALRRRAGLQVDSRGERVVCYTFRHTAATRAAARGVRDRILAKLMGHTSTRTTARYQHLDADDVLLAFHRHMFPKPR